MEYKLSDLSITNSDHKLNFEVAVFTVSYENSSWKYVLVSMAAYALQPIALPIMILLSKLLNRKINWFPVKSGV